MTFLKQKIWLNGEIIDAGAHISTRDRGFLLGDGVFETLLVKAGRPVFVKAHLMRMENGLQRLGFEKLLLPDLDGVFRHLAQVNTLESEDCVGRITVTRGSGGRGLAPACETAPTIMVSLGALGRPDCGPLRLCISREVRFSGGATNMFKSISGYAAHIMARRDAAGAGYDDAILLNEHGRVVCASAANIFVLDAVSGAIATPSLEEGAMPGVVREMIIKIARNRGWTLKQQTLEISDIERAALFLTNSAIGLQAAFIGDGPMETRHDMFDDLVAAYHNEIAMDLA